MTEKQVLAYEGWGKTYAEFTPDKNILTQVAAKLGKGLKIDVYLAFWCGDSCSNVPPFLKIVEQLRKAGAADLQVNYISLKKKADKSITYFVEKLKVQRVPTFIFYRDGKEIGRIIENPKKTLLEDFLEILR
ncbi:MAG: thioredoxin family protein [bacterium]|nr:thioredoxin family protein [bacterium]